MSSYFVLVASPLVGPLGWQWVSEELATQGHRVCIPELARPDSSPPIWRAHVDAITRAIRDEQDVLLVGHSGAGRLIPLVADALDRSTPCMFIDALLPLGPDQHPDDPPDPDDWFLAHVRSLAVDGVLPPWSEWWGTEVWKSLVPDPSRRAELGAALPRVTLASVEEEPSPPVRWSGPAAYLRFSEMYRAEADDAQGRGWIVDKLVGEHLHMTVDPAGVARSLVALAERLGES